MIVTAQLACDTLLIDDSCATLVVVFLADNIVGRSGIKNVTAQRPARRVFCDQYGEDRAEQAQGWYEPLQFHRRRIKVVGEERGQLVGCGL